jgi:excisionase family DNA binding protein
VEKPTLLDYAAAAEYLGLSEYTLRRYVSLRRIGFVKLGLKAVRFRPDQLDRFIEAGTVSARERAR